MWVEGLLIHFLNGELGKVNCAAVLRLLAESMAENHSRMRSSKVTGFLMEFTLDTQDIGWEVYA